MTRYDMNASNILINSGFNGIMAFSFCFTSVAVVTSVTALFIEGLATGGPAVLIWSWLGGSFFTICTCLSLGEIASTYPSSGSVYHWAALLTTPEWHGFAAYATGWFNCIGNVAGDAFMSWAFAVSCSAALKVLGYEELSTNSMVLISVAVNALWAFQNLLRVDIQGWMNNFGSFWQIATTAAVLGVLIVGNGVSGGVAATPSQVFSTFYNNTGFQSPVYVVFIGVLLSAFSFTGYEAVSHMAEETKDAEKAIPKGIMYTGLATAVMGFALLLGLLFVTAGNVDEIVQNGWTISDVFVKVGGRGCGIVLSFMLCVNMYFSGFSSLTSTSRLIFAMSRDGAFPGSSYFERVTKDTCIPIGAVFLTMVLDWLLLSLNLFSETAFEAITSLCTIGLQVSYGIPIFLRVTGYGRSTFVQGQFNLGKYSIICGYLSCFWLFFTSAMFLLPTEFPITLENMPWAPIVILVVSACGLAYWQLVAKSWFKGPHRLPHLM